jgi:hypothetical protein
MEKMQRQGLWQVPTFHKSNFRQEEESSQHRVERDIVVQVDLAVRIGESMSELDVGKIEICRVRRIKWSDVVDTVLQSDSKWFAGEINWGTTRSGDSMLEGHGCRGR